MNKFPKLKKPKKKNRPYYLLIIWGDVEAELRGPYETRVLRDAEAKKIVQADGDRRNEIFQLDMEGALPRIFHYSGGETSRWLEEVD